MTSCAYVFPVPFDDPPDSSFELVGRADQLLIDSWKKLMRRSVKDLLSDVVQIAFRSDPLHTPFLHIERT